jgi:hypothetical protein
LMKAQNPDVQKTKGDNDLKNKRYNFHLRFMLVLEDARERWSSVTPSPTQ